MLFNSYVFLLCFLPCTLLIYQIVSKLHASAPLTWLAIASLAFYGYWRPAFLIVLGTSILFNFLISNLISRTIPNQLSTRIWLWTGIVGNLGALCWFKYLFPILNFAHSRFGIGPAWAIVALPLGISFFTFTQIGYLVDLQQGTAKQERFINYVVFVTFFPHLIAGPILHHKDIMPQFKEHPHRGLRADDVAVGLSWFAMGMWKKVFIADHLAPMADAVFSANGLLASSTAWIGVLAYAMQIYFDFSGYCDMACGLARMFSIDFPLNFASPYKSASIIEFWQRWHMTLTQYIGSYLYSPIQFWISERRLSAGKKVSRKAQTKPEGFAEMIMFPTVFTMFIAGIWHGAGLQFLVFGLLHGIYLTVNHGWRLFRHGRGNAKIAPRWRLVARIPGVALTFLCVVVALIFFRAPSVLSALHLIQRMVLMRTPAHASADPFLDNQLWLLAAACVIVWAFPNTQQILARYKPALRLAPSDDEPRLLPIYWSPRPLWGFALGAVLLAALVEVQNPSTFLYFQF